MGNVIFQFMLGNSGALDDGMEHCNLPGCVIFFYYKKKTNLT